MENYFFKETPVGCITVCCEENFVTGIHFEKREGGRENALIKEVFSQLEEYFIGERREFSLPLKFYGTEFQERVWNELLKIPYGKAISYKELAEAVGSPNASRAVGNANGKNPIAIVVPCHRVIAHDGSLGGYSGGLEIKRMLLEIEKITVK